MDSITFVIIAITVVGSVIGFIVKRAIIKNIDKAVDKYGERNQVNNSPREISLSDNDTKNR